MRRASRGAACTADAAVAILVADRNRLDLSPHPNGAMNDVAVATARIRAFAWDYLGPAAV